MTWCGTRWWEEWGNWWDSGRWAGGSAGGITQSGDRVVEGLNKSPVRVRGVGTAQPHVCAINAYWHLFHQVNLFLVGLIQIDLKYIHL